MQKTGIGKKIKELRELKGISIDLLVYDIKNKYEISIDKSMVSRWENEINEPSLERAIALSKYFDVSLDYLIGLTDDKTPARLRNYAKQIKKKNVAKEGD